MNVNEAAKKYGVCGSTVRKWCIKNKVKRKLGKQGVMEYDLSEKDLAKFEIRRGKGWQKGNPRKSE